MLRIYEILFCCEDLVMNNLIVKGILVFRSKILVKSFNYVMSIDIELF